MRLQRESLPWVRESLSSAVVAGALAHSYAYSFASSVSAEGALSLAASGTEQAGRPFFDARAAYPYELALLLRGVSDVVRSRHHIPAAMLERILLLADPVFTVSREMLRVEGFSSCCGLYARADFDAAAFEGMESAPGSTNVDFNEAMRGALGRIRPRDGARLCVAESGVDLHVHEADASRQLVERKVELPLRWIKSFLEVQMIQARMEPRAELTAVAALRFLRTLPRTGKSSECAWLVPSAGSLRLTRQASTSALRLAGFARLRVLEALLPHAKQLRIYEDPLTRASAWEVQLNHARFTLALSPDTWRAFSGEGQALRAIALPAEGLARVRAMLHWQSQLDVTELCTSSGLEKSAMDSVLAKLGSFGAVGFDLGRAAWFHRVLPIDLDSALAHLERQQPRLRAAGKLLAEGAVSILEQNEALVRGEVRSGDVVHRVRIDAGEGRCTCPWFVKHQNERGACKHVLALELASNSQHSKRLEP